MSTENRKFLGIEKKYWIGGAIGLAAIALLGLLL